MAKETQSRRIRQDTGHHRRILVTMLALGVAAFLPAAARLHSLMVTDFHRYSALALNNQTRTTRVAAQRGVIYDRNMDILAGNESVETVYLNPNELRQTGADLEKVASFLSGELGKEESWILEEGKKYAYRYRQVGASVDQETAGRIRSFLRENEISGVYLEPAQIRSYPCGSLAAQTIGFVGAQGDGVEGIEASCNAYLSGTQGKVVTTRGNHEITMPYSYEEFIPSQEGASVILTLDVTVQQCLERQMEAAIARYDVQNGAFGLVMNCKTGEILAMATLGSFDPNAYLEIGDPEEAARLEQLRLEQLMGGGESYDEQLRAARLKQWRNRCISDGYEPGSTFKVLTMAAALDCGAITLNTPFHCSGAEQIPGRSQLLHCWRSQGHGAQQTPQALQNSCNLAFAHIALKLGGDRFYDYIQRFGVLEKTGVDLAGESRGIFFDKSLVTDTEKWGTASLTSGSFGQTFKITALQLVRAISSVVNGGYLMEPYLVSEVLDAQGNVLLRQEPTVVRQTISRETSDIMRQLIRSVVTEGTAKNAAVAGFSIGGKTGTSEKIDVFDENGQRVLDKIVSFVGIAPMEDPEYIVLVALDTPSRETGIYISGGVMAAPTVGAVMADILPYLGVERTYGPEELAGKSIVLPDLTGLPPQEALQTLKKLGLQGVLSGDGEQILAQLPRPGETVSGEGQVLLYLEEAVERQVEIPDFLGLNRQQASDAAGLLGLNILILGNMDVSPQVTVTAQDIPAKTLVPAGTTITLTFTDTTAH